MRDQNIILNAKAPGAPDIFDLLLAVVKIESPRVAAASGPKMQNINFVK